MPAGGRSARLIYSGESNSEPHTSVDCVPDNIMAADNLATLEEIPSYRDREFETSEVPLCLICDGVLKPRDPKNPAREKRGKKRWYTLKCVCTILKPARVYTRDIDRGQLILYRLAEMDDPEAGFSVHNECRTRLQGNKKINAEKPVPVQRRPVRERPSPDEVFGQLASMTSPQKRTWRLQNKRCPGTNCRTENEWRRHRMDEIQNPFPEEEEKPVEVRPDLQRQLFGEDYGNMESDSESESPKEVKRSSPNLFLARRDMGISGYEQKRKKRRK